MDIKDIKELDDNDLVTAYKECKINLKKGYTEAKEKNNIKEFLKTIIKIEDEIKKRHIPFQSKNLNYCTLCKKYWKNNEYCPHPFDEDVAYKLWRRSAKLKIDSSIIKFYDKDGNLIGEYKEHGNLQKNIK